VKTCVIFGGTGFIGSYYAEYYLRNQLFDRVILADLLPVCQKRFGRLLQQYFDAGVLQYMLCDVRSTICEQVPSVLKVELVVNLAAVHREPGHEAREYYETNLLGAENVCSWATLVGCKDIVFTSSIAPYGVEDEQKDEDTLPVPATAYGGSKLAAEKIHGGWCNETSDRCLTIVRPGVVFGAGEGGNVTRLIKATLRGYFVFMGNQETRKAGVYVNELIRALRWVHRRQSGVTLFNMTMSPAPSVLEYVQAIQSVAGKRRWIPSVHFRLLYLLSYLIDGFARLVNYEQPISPVRLRKLINSNHISPSYLLKNGYIYKYTLDSALTEWKSLAPDDWC
jgi:nucleoside-diphosphate-sugar epimerase